MKLSEAILLGSTIRPQCFDRRFSSDGRSCAIGAACEALGTHNLQAVYPWITRQTECPKCGERVFIDSLIALHLNDMHGWTRERIAEWIATVEPQEVIPEGDNKLPLCGSPKAGAGKHNPGTANAEEVLELGASSGSHNGTIFS